MEDILVFSPPAPEYFSSVVNYKLGEVSGWLKEEGYEFDQKSLFVECRYLNRYRFRKDFVDLSVFESDKLIKYLKGHRDEDIIAEAEKLADMLSIEEYDTIIVPLEGDQITSTRDPRMEMALPILKEHAEDKLVIIGGVNLDDSELEKFSFVDYAIDGDFEFPLSKIFSHEEDGESLGVEPGIRYKKDGEVVRGDSYQHPLDMKPTPYFRKELLDKYAKISLREIPIIPYKLGRGCSQNCSFCTYFEDQKYQYKSIEKVISDLKKLEEETGASNYRFMEQNILNNPDYLEDLSIRFQEELDISWTSLGIIISRDQEFFDNLASGGCKAIYHGIESASNSVLHRMQKHQTRKMLEETLKKEYKAGIKPFAGFITDYVDESMEEYYETVEFVKENKHLMGGEASSLRIYPSKRQPLYTENERFDIELEDREDEDWRGIKHNYNMGFEDSRGDQGKINEPKRSYKRDYLMKLAQFELFVKNFGRQHPITFLRLQLDKLITKDYPDVTHEYV